MQTSGVEAAYLYSSYRSPLENYRGLSDTLVGEHYTGPPLGGSFQFMSKKVTVMLKGGPLRSHAKRARLDFNPEFIEKTARTCALNTEEIFRILNLVLTTALPIQRQPFCPFQEIPKRLRIVTRGCVNPPRNIGSAIRRGVLKFRGSSSRKYLLDLVLLFKIPISSRPLSKKEVDMRIGLDVAIISEHRAVELIALATNDTDCIPAVKHARRSGLQVALIIVPGYNPAPELLSHCDFSRRISGPYVSRCGLGFAGSL